MISSDTEADSEIWALEEAVWRMHSEVCDQCGKCSSACPVSKEIEGFNPRQLVTRIALGHINEVLDEDAIWTCTTCLKCRERCPEEISPYNIILALRNLAYRMGLNYPIGYDDFINGILERGYISSPRSVRTRTGERVTRITLELPEPSVPMKMNAFKGNLEEILRVGSD
jgi:heterodisulfide reductase subunit C